MSNETPSSLSSQAYINDVYLSKLQVYMAFGALTLLIYASFSHLVDEVEYIWKRTFTLPTYLYILTKYPLLFYFSTFLVDQLSVSSLSLCNELGILVQVMELLPFIGVQGLISLRTYSLCYGYRPMSIMLAATFFIIFSIDIYAFTVPYCGSPSSSPSFSNPDVYFILNIIRSVAIVLSDVLAFIAVIHQVWGLWKLKRGLGLQNNEDVVTSILRQGILRFSFVLFITAALIFLNIFSPVASEILSFLQQILSALIICEFTLDLRRRNEQRMAPNSSALNLPTLTIRGNLAQSVKSVLGRLHASIVAEMGERNVNLIGIDGSSSLEPNDLQNNYEMDLGHGEALYIQDA